jgi:pimeloyl-ACP methyl ester carboxylesterase
MHSHPERIVVAVRGGKLRITDGNGKVEIVEVKVGDVEHLDPQTHTVTNIGTTTFEEVSTEFVTPYGKQPPEAIPPSRPNDAVDRAPNTEAPVPRALPQTTTQAPQTQPPAIVTEKAKSTEAQQPPAQLAPQRPQQASIASQLEERVAPVSPVKGAKTIQVGGQELTYVELGSGEPLVLVHSAVTDLRNWSQQIDELAKRYRVIAYSQRYHYPNKATGKEGDFTFDQNAADLLALITQLNLGKVHVIGNAYGGAVVVNAAIKEPTLFRSLTVMEPPFEALLPELQASATRYARNQIFSMVRREILKRHNVEGAMHTFVDWSRTSGTWDALSIDGRQRYLDNGNALAAYSAHPEAPAFSCDDGKKLSVPLLVVQGEASAPNHRIISSTLTECVAGAKRVVITQAGHEMHRENAAEFNKAVLEFLNSVK